MTSWAWWFHFFGDDIVAPETEAGFCPKSEHIIFQHWVPTFGKPIIKFLGFGFAQLLLSLRLDNSLFFQFFNFTLKNKQFQTIFIETRYLSDFSCFSMKNQNFLHVFALDWSEDLHNGIFVPDLCLQCFRGPDLFGTCSGLVRVSFGFVLFLFFLHFCGRTWSELVRNLFGFRSGLVRVQCGIVFFLSSPGDFPNGPFLGARHNFHQFQPRKSLILPSCSLFSHFIADFRLEASDVKDFQILRT